MCPGSYFLLGASIKRRKKGRLPDFKRALDSQTYFLGTKDRRKARMMSQFKIKQTINYHRSLFLSFILTHKSPRIFTQLNSKTIELRTLDIRATYRYLASHYMVSTSQQDVKQYTHIIYLNNHRDAFLRSKTIYINKH